MRNDIGTATKPILTRVAEMTLTTSKEGTGSVFITEVNDLTLVEERVLTSPENPGYVMDSAPSSDQWEFAQKWEDEGTLSADWRSQLTSRRTGIAVEVAKGDLTIDLVNRDSLLTLATGVVHAAGGQEHHLHRWRLELQERDASHQGHGQLHDAGASRGVALLRGDRRRNGGRP